MTMHDRRSLRRSLVIALTLAGSALVACSKADPHATDICTRAADRWEACARELLGPEMGAMAASKRNVAACARDERTVAMYEKCLPAATCQAMMDCMDGEAMRAH